MVSKYVVCRTQVEGFHAWSDAPEKYSFLRHRHHHIFHIEARFPVVHNNRDIEFIVKANEIKQYLEAKYSSAGFAPCEFGSMSCEDIAEEIINVFHASACEVNEDGYGGAVVAR